MAKARALDKRRKSIQSTRKITHTMELVASAQFRKAMERALAASAYTERIAALVGDLARAGLKVAHPLLEERPQCKSTALLVLTANRGLCGGYNSSILRMGHKRLEELKAEGQAVRHMVSGNRGASYMKFRNVQIDEFFNQFDHHPLFEQVNVIAEGLLTSYLAGEIDRVEVVYTRFISLSKQYATIETLLPLSELANTQNAEAETTKGQVDYEFLPSPESILEEVVPMAFKMKLFKCFLDAAVSEQIARRKAMKAATDNADSMISILTTTYNRARQSQITNEIIEVVSGASAMK
ncbi:MAG: ATP synthase F1 subunit gamma [Thermoguttaceae bacterium]|nr:ATP synthase F1 subunit gamma [Thermoguttaceae bacterium]